MHALRGVLRAACRSTHQQPLPLRVAQRAATSPAAVGIGDDSLEQGLEMIRHSAMVSGVEQVGVVLDDVQTGHAPSSPMNNVRSNFAVSVSAVRAVSTRLPGTRIGLHGRILRARTSTWNSGLRLKIARRMRAPPPASRRAHPGGHRRPGTPPAPDAAARENWDRPRGRCAAPGVLTKNPISPSDLCPVAVGDGRAHHDVVLTRVAGQQRLEGRQERHEQGHFFPATESQERF